MYANLTAKERNQVMARVNELQLDETLGMVNSMVRHCFEACVSSFTDKELTAKEKSCAEQYITKYQEYTTRVATRFQEINTREVQM